MVVKASRNIRIPKIMLTITSKVILGPDAEKESGSESVREGIGDEEADEEGVDDGERHLVCEQDVMVTNKRDVFAKRQPRLKTKIDSKWNWIQRRHLRQSGNGLTYAHEERAYATVGPGKCVGTFASR